MNALANAAQGPGRRISLPRLLAVALSGAIIAVECGSAASISSTTAATSSTGTPNAYTAVYKSISFGSTVSVSFPSACQMTLTTSGKPDYTPNAYYLAPTNSGQTPVAYTAVTNTPLAVISYASVIAPSLRGSSATLNICPTQASSTTVTSLGAIGYLISGTAMFNPYEMDQSTPAISDNASYTFTDGTGTQQTAYFLDQCASHSNGMTWHAHGNLTCVTSQVDAATGSSHIIGIALDGFPIYGGRDINGSIVSVSQLDACNGISSPTPEFPSGAYHYVLPIGVSTRNASINCYRGSVSSSTLASAGKLACNMKTMFAMIEKQHDNPFQQSHRRPSPPSPS
jgi:hypothetical protein